MTDVSRDVATTHVEPGPGLVARLDNVVAWAEPEPGPLGRQSFDVLVVGLQEIGRQLLAREQAATQVASLLADARVMALPGVAAVVPTASGLMAVAQGWGTVVGREAPDRSPEQPAATLQMIDLTDEVVVLGRRDAATRLATGATELTAHDDRTVPTGMGLVQGVVPGGAALVGTRITIASRAEDVADRSAGRPGPSPSDGGGTGRPPGPTVTGEIPVTAGVAPTGVTDVTSTEMTGTEPDATNRGATGGSGADGAGTGSADVELVALRGPQAPPVRPRPPLPVVSATAGPSTEVEPDGGSRVRIEGIRCVRGHLNNPIALHCGSCGISMIQRSSARVEGIRPPLGVMVFDDGSIVALTSDFILGTAPDGADAVVRGQAQGLKLQDPSAEIEALHAEVRLEGWDVTLIDWSNRGTYVLPEDASAWQVAPRGIPTTLTPGTRIAIGHRTLVFDSTHTR